MKRCYLLLCGLLFVGACEKENPVILFENDRYTLYDNAVKQGEFTAIATSATEILSDYQSPADAQYSPRIQFKFSINSRDNEQPSGQDHSIIVNAKQSPYISPVIVFGENFSDNGTLPSISLPPNTIAVIRADMRPLLQAFAQKGYYDTPTGDRIFESDFKGVFIAGGSLPLTWDFENLYSKPEMQLTDADGDSIYEVTLTLNPESKQQNTSFSWHLQAGLDSFPHYQSDQLLVDALYNMALEESQKVIRPDGTLRAGEEWDGVWTRDISYSIYLSMVYIQPEASRKSLIAKVKNNRIIQDTGTGGAWPVSTDRVVWAIAAWEYYLFSGDTEWLRYAYEVVRNTLYDDQFTARDSRTGLFRGEQSYLDWREQSYPRWMEPIDIYQSLSLGTNILHATAYRILGDMASALQEPSDLFYNQARWLNEAIEEYLWIPTRKHFGQYLYGGIYPILSPGNETLGESLAILFEVASPQQAYDISANHPVTDFGTPSIYPELVNIKPYHNNAVWPFVQAYWNLAAAKANNERAVLHGLGALYRAAALFGTNQELFVASSGDFRGTAVNSRNMLWSLSGNIAMIYRLFFGMNFQSGGILFSPYVPSPYEGKKEIFGFRYRDARLKLELSGTGNRIQSFLIDGEKVDRPFVPATLKGEHTISITLSNQNFEAAALRVEPIRYLPETTLLRYDAEHKSGTIENFFAGYIYQGYINGVFSGVIPAPQFPMETQENLTEIAVTPVSNSLEGFSGKPLSISAAGCTLFLEAESFAPKATHTASGYSGNGFIETTLKHNATITFGVHVSQEGFYYIDVRYANGNGPINTQNKCAIRSLYIEKERIGALIMPQRGENEWSNWGYSNPVRCMLKAGNNQLSIRYTPPQDVNMNGDTNSAFIDGIRLRKGNTQESPYPVFSPFPLR